MRNAALLAVAACALCSGPAPAQQVYVLPYVQPGDGSALTGTDTKVVCWMTDLTPGEFTVEYTGPGRVQGSVKPVRVALDFPPYKPKPLPVAPPPREVVGPPKPKDPDDPNAEPKEPKVPLPPEAEQKFFLYAATLTDLPFDATVAYRVKLGGKLIREASFRTRATADKTVRCVLVGDLAQGREGQKAIAYRIGLEKPEFIVALGDIVYPTGRMNQYTAFFWHTYNNVPEPSLKTGAPLMATVPFYAVLGNHDISAKPATVPDALAAYYFFHGPKNGPGDGPWATPLGTDAASKKFRANSFGNYPALDAYSFDYGPAHFTVLNDNARMAITDPAFTKWLRADLTGTKARWKFVCYHVPGFQASRQHYTEQQARQLQPLFEECGVDATFAGHVHNYQRSVPLKFVPDGKGPVRGKVNGEFTLDTDFDGLTNTVPNGVIHFVAGGGGASLYGPAPEKVAADLKKLHGDNFAPFTAKATADKHTFVVLDLAPDKFELRALAADGTEIDKITVTKKK
jgi:predicted phosphodiesterase